MTEKCPGCNKEFEKTHSDKAKSCICPNCKKQIYFGYPAKNLVLDENGVLKKKYKPKK